MSQHVSKTLRTTVSSLGLALGLCALGLSANASATEFTVSINKTQILHLPAAASTVVVGNPDIADVSVHSSNTLFLVGRGYGETNLIALDDLGQTIMDATITVQAGMPASGIRLIKIGEGQESYNCTPSCLPAPVLGDSNGFQARFGSNAGPLNNTQASSGTTVTTGPNGQIPTALSAFPGAPSGPTSANGPSPFAGPPSNER